ncbi:MAG: hypothetical protein CVU71_13930 [Deltaproteobacteria bacterium HGW-Deltaproteobacteria-6]|jgi:hypothetical protein|nr:MAG: hypothetical protein CVU71_13930 [Deltaproteobacteria bacterium HGW-Deltaproteobacteria-6]
MTRKGLVMLIAIVFAGIALFMVIGLHVSVTQKDGTAPAIVTFSLPKDAEAVNWCSKSFNSVMIECQNQCANAYSECCYGHSQDVQNMYASGCRIGCMKYRNLYKSYCEDKTAIGP